MPRKINLKDIDIEWVRDLAYKNVEIQNGDKHASLASSGCFAWHETPEGDDFWWSVYDIIIKCGCIDTDLMSTRNPDGHKAYKKVTLKLKLDKYINLI